MQKVVKSLKNPLVKHLVKIRKEAKYRKNQKEILISGKNLILELANKIPIKIFITSHEKLPQFDINPSLILKTTSSIIKKITHLATSDGYAATFAMPQETKSFKGKKLLILDEIADPGNLGTIIRTALALGWHEVIITPRSVDPFNDKTLRASRGAIFFISFAIKSVEKIERILERGRYNIYSADCKGGSIEIKVKTPLALILSSETHGLKEWAQQAQKITIPISPQVESLNVAAAASILMFEMKDF